MTHQETSIVGISPQDFFISKGLYETYQYTEENISKVIGLVYYRGSLDCYCTGCNSESIFNPIETRSSPMYNSPDPQADVIVYGLKNSQVVNTMFVCGRKSEHKLLFTMLVNRGTISKIGQFPSYADISLQDIEKYRKLLPNDLFLEFKKSIGLYAHNVGAGSVVYLRRIIEKFMIEPAYQQAKEEADWNEKLYFNYSMRERMNLLSNYLPDYLVSNSIIYSIVSKSVHELSEKECLIYYPVLKSFIEVVLTDIKNKKDNEIVRKKLSTELSSIASKI